MDYAALGEVRRRVHTVEASRKCWLNIKFIAMPATEIFEYFCCKAAAMELKIFTNYHTLSHAAAGFIIDRVRANPQAVLCLAAGDTPKETYALLAANAAGGLANFSECTFIGLDEWIGIPPDNQGSCQHFLRHHLFAPLKVGGERIHLFNALAADLNGECQKMDQVIRQLGGIDLMLVGVGMNGHIGFNEPGVREDLYAHVVELDSTTRQVGQKYFTVATALEKGITLGLRHMLESRTAILMASGPRKAEVVRQALEGPVSTTMPASLIRRHPNSIVMVDQDAASHLGATS